MKLLERLQLLLAALAILAPAAHVLEMPNKLALDGALWLAVQRHLDIRVPRAMDVHSLQAGGR